jgi:hypothetical protein
VVVFIFVKKEVGKNYLPNLPTPPLKKKETFFKKFYLGSNSPQTGLSVNQGYRLLGAEGQHPALC